MKNQEGASREVLSCVSLRIGGHTAWCVLVIGMVVVLVEGEAIVVVYCNGEANAKPL